MKRVEVAEKYKSFAFACICEAISIYIQGTEDELERSMPPLLGTIGYIQQVDRVISIGDYLRPGGITTLWAAAVEWCLNKKERRAFHYEHFRNWWIRAAMAQGHAEWLIQELKDSQGKHDLLYFLLFRRGFLYIGASL